MKIVDNCPKKLSSIKESFTARCEASAKNDNVFLANKLISEIDLVINNPPSLKDLFKAK